MSGEEFEALESEILARLRDIREGRHGAGPDMASGDYTITGVEATFEGDEH
jgi:hypothetical protein